MKTELKNNEKTPAALRILADFLSSGGSGLENLKGYFEFLADEAEEGVGAAPAPDSETYEIAVRLYALSFGE